MSINSLENFWTALKNLQMIIFFFYILGDTNINVMKSNKRIPYLDRYLQAITSNGAQSLITEPT